MSCCTLRTRIEHTGPRESIIVVYTPAGTRDQELVFRARVERTANRAIAAARELLAATLDELEAAGCGNPLVGRPEITPGKPGPHPRG